jgi:tetratricopeptide (TPR) repeat protein
VVCEQGDYAKARMLYEESLSMRSGMGDKSGIADSLYMLGKLAYWQGEYVAARASFEESLSLCREMGDKSAIALALTHLGNVVSSQSDYAAAQALHEESLRLCREMGFKLGSAIALVDVGYEAYLQGDYIKARLSYEECLALCKEMDEKQVMAYALFGLGLLDLTVNKPEAREHILHSLRLRWDTGERLQQTSSLIGAAGLVLEEGNPQFAAELLGAVESVLKGLGAVMEPELKPFHTRTLEAARGQLGKAAFQSAWEEGGQWSLEEAVKKVLGE